jgi:uncharacterized phage protein gp47/JayE
MSLVPAMTLTGEAALLAGLLRHLPGYTPEWSAARSGAGYSLLQAYAHLAGVVSQRLEQVPNRDLLAGLEMLGLNLLSASAARAPLVFAVAPDSPVDVTLPAGSQVAATPSQVVPTIGAPVAPAPDPVIFATETTVTVTPGIVKTLYSIDPGSDSYVDHSRRLTSGFTLFTDLQPAEHHLYLGHDHLFALGGSVSVLISFVLQRAAPTPLKLVWEYYTAVGWLPLPHDPEDDTTGGLVSDGQVTLRRACGPNTQKTPVGPVESYWIRARLATPLETTSIAPVVAIDDIAVRVGVTKEGLPLDGAFADAATLDVSKDFLPFGATPALSTTFYMSCADAFSRGGANIKIDFALSQTASAHCSAQLAWEYSSSTGWQQLLDTPYKFTADGSIAFQSPADWAEIEVNSSVQRWMRVRITSGDFGRPPYVIGIVSSQPTFGGGDLLPPIAKTVAVTFQQQTDPERLDHCLTYNDFIYRDVSEAARWPGQQFSPFLPVADPSPAVHFGFSRTLPDGLASVFVQLAGRDNTAQSTSAPSNSPFVWEYRAAAGWRELAVLDETRGFQTSGMLQFIGPDDAVLTEGLGGRAYWLRARLKAGEGIQQSSIAGLWLNAVWASQHALSDRELLGRSDGNPGQSFQLVHWPVLQGEVVEVQEWTGRGDYWRGVLADVPAADIRLDKDPATGVPIAAWVRWQLRDNLYSSQSTDRHYVLERATGLLRFGTNPIAAGKQIVVSYSYGGGVSGNVAAGAITQLRTAAPYIVGATNVVGAQGGADSEDTPAVLVRGPQHLRHRNRGISANDFEWVAREASPEVARVRCMPLTGNDGRAQRGWVTLLIVPNSIDAQPELADALALEVQAYVSARVSAGVRIRVVAPQYSLVSVRAIVIPIDPGSAALVESSVRTALNNFLHPLHGGREGAGWAFGESVRLSHVAAVIEAVDGVEHSEATQLLVDGVLGGMSLAIPSDRLVAAGSHELVLRIGAR